jgi:hypothetical protein
MHSSPWINICVTSNSDWHPCHLRLQFLLESVWTGLDWTQFSSMIWDFISYFSPLEVMCLSRCSAPNDNKEQALQSRPKHEEN